MNKIIQSYNKIFLINNYFLKYINYFLFFVYNNYHYFFLILKMGRCTRCSCTHYVAPSIPESIGQKLTGGAFLGCVNCGHHVNLHE